MKSKNISLVFLALFLAVSIVSFASAGYNVYYGSTPIWVSENVAGILGPWNWNQCTFNGQANDKFDLTFNVPIYMFLDGYGPGYGGYIGTSSALSSFSLNMRTYALSNGLDYTPGHHTMYAVAIDKQQASNPDWYNIGNFGSWEGDIPAESCNGADDDCDGLVDESAPSTNGVWSDWSWGSWYNDYGSGCYQYYRRDATRTCTAPSCGGTQCSGDSTNYETSAGAYGSYGVVNGQWSSYGSWYDTSSWSTCSSGSQSKNQQRDRTCTAPSCGGADCSGSTYETQTVTQSCTVVVTTSGTTPTITISSPTSTIYGTTLITLTASSTQTITNWTYSLDGAAQASFTNGGTIPAADGSHTVTVYGTNSNGTGSASVSFTVDVTAPVFTNLVNLTVQNINSLGYDIDATDTNGVSCFTVNDTRFSINCSGYLKNATALSTGLYWLTVMANDTVNNQRTGAIYVNVTQNSPTVTIISPTSTIYTITSGSTYTITLNANSTQTITSWTYSLDGAPSASFTPGSTTISVGAATHSLVVYGTNSNGTGQASVSFTVSTGAGSGTDDDEDEDEEDSEDTLKITQATKEPNVIKSSSTSKIDITTKSSKTDTFRIILYALAGLILLLIIIIIIVILFNLSS